MLEARRQTQTPPCHLRLFSAMNGLCVPFPRNIITVNTEREILDQNISRMTVEAEISD